MLARGNEIFHFNDALSEQQTYISSEKFHLEEGETMLAQGNEICFNFNFNDALVSSTRTLPVKIFTWKKEKPCSPGAQKNFPCAGRAWFLLLPSENFTLEVYVCGSLVHH